MIASWGRCLSLPAVLLATSLLPAAYWFPPRTQGDMEARLRVEVAQHTTEPGLAELTLTLTITGPETLEVETPRLEDAADAWRDQRGPIRRDASDRRVTWSQVMRLKQVKPGLEPVADVTVLFRRAANAEWSEAKWINILREIREVPEPPPAELATQASWWRRGGVALLMAVVALLILFVWLRKRFHRLEPSLPPDTWALHELDRLEQNLLPPCSDAGTYHTQLSYIVRRYLTERSGLKAMQRTTAELLDAVRQTSQLSAEQQTQLSELFERCDLAKFAHAGAPPEECQRTAALARALVRQTPPTASR